jgi:oligosaccharide repeat unit polymerase
MYGKGGNEENTIVENMKQASQATAVYLVSAVNALDWDLHHQFQISYSGNNSLRLFRKIGDHFNLTQNAKIPDLVQPFVFVPYPTNVYTVYSPYIKDFGKWYAWFMVAVFGFIHSFVHNKAITTKNFRYSLYYSFLLFPLLISFFADFYLTIFSTWIQVIFFTELFIFLNDLWKYQCKRDFYLDKPVNQ